MHGYTGSSLSLPIAYLINQTLRGAVKALITIRLARPNGIVITYVRARRARQIRKSPILRK